VGGLWRHRCCGGHRLIAESQPQRQTIASVGRMIFLHIGRWNLAVSSLAQ
jgi:hypothetical protein